MHFVYKITLGEEVQYVGMTTNLNHRFNQHELSKKWLTVDHKFYYKPLENKTMAICYEMFLINKLQPRYNISANRMDDVSGISFSSISEEWIQHQYKIKEDRVFSKPSDPFNKIVVKFSEILPKRQMQILNHMMKHRTKSNNVFGGTQREIAKDTGVSLKTVNFTIKALKEANFLQEVRSGTYQLNPDFIFKGKPGNRMRVLLEYNQIEKE